MLIHLHRVQMYYKKRPELVTMIEEFYCSYRSLVDRYDQLKCEPGSKTSMPFGWLFASKSSTDKTSEQYESFELEGSEVDDPESDEEIRIGYCNNTDNGKSVEWKRSEKTSHYDGEIDGHHELMKLREKVTRLTEENRIHKAEISEMRENKREVIRQLCMSIEMMEENTTIRRCMKDSCKWSFMEFPKWKMGFPLKFL